MKQLAVTSRRSVLALGAGALAASVVQWAEAAVTRSVVVELFTSQGCSSCPPADAFLTELRSMPGVVAMTYHVDYWDYLGWKDTFGAPEYSQRQYDYSRTRGDMDVYTPQMIVDGAEHFVGSNRATVLDAIKKAQAKPAGVPMTLTDKGSELVVTVDAAEGMAECMVWLMPIVPRASVKILKGEIAGQTIEYHNIVRALIPAGTWSGGAKTIAMPKDGVLTSGKISCIALLQQPKAGPILGVAHWGDTGA